MLNMFKLRKWTAFLLVGLSSVIGFYMGLVFYGFLWGLIIMLVCNLVFSLVGNMLIATPFRAMIEGKGVLVLNLDSTGIIKPTIVGLQSPFLRGKMGKKEINDVWNRSTVMQLETPRKSNKVAKVNDRGGLTIDIDEKKFNEARFALFHYPVLIYNDQIESLLTKDFLSEKEKGTFAEHGVLFLNRRIEELTMQIRNFGRYVVESTRPKGNLLQNKWFWIVIVGLIVLMILLFLPSIVDMFSSMWKGTSGAVSTGVRASNTVVPR